MLELVHQTGLILIPSHPFFNNFNISGEIFCSNLDTSPYLPVYLSSLMLNLQLPCLYTVDGCLFAPTSTRHGQVKCQVEP